MNSASITLAQLFRYYKGLPHQTAAIAELEEDIKANGYAVAMRRDRPWFATWSQSGIQPEPVPRVTNPLSNFPFFSQLDNGPEGWRQCQTSSLAMCLAYLKVNGIKTDLDYLRVVEKYGDTTTQAAHQAALKKLGVRARFVQNCTATQLQAEIRSGYPVAVGMLHRGPVTAPSGGGHYVVVYGFDATSYIVMDPYGEQDLVNGGWSRVGGGAGRAIRYSLRNFNARWLPDGSASGWAWLFS